MFLGVTEVVLFLRGLEGDTWVQLWAGVFGAVPAAVISAAVAAGVAAWVLNRSNIQQQVLARQAVNVQRQLSQEQLAEQRREAAIVRERAAAAGVLIAAQDFIPAVLGREGSVSKHQGIFRTAVARWRIELGFCALSDELVDWPNVLFRAAAICAWADASGTDDQKEAATTELAELIGAVMAIALAWASTDVLEQEAGVERLRMRRKKFEEFKESEAGKMAGF